jgi:hypothetical protein
MIPTGYEHERSGNSWLGYCSGVLVGGFGGGLLGDGLAVDDKADPSPLDIHSQCDDGTRGDHWERVRRIPQSRISRRTASIRAHSSGWLLHPHPQPDCLWRGLASHRRPMQWLVPLGPSGVVSRPPANPTLAPSPPSWDAGCVQIK